ncbi:unnamed protein product, partial [Allacma fusca]
LISNAQGCVLCGHNKKQSFNVNLKITSTRCKMLSPLSLELVH